MKKITKDEFKALTPPYPQFGMTTERGWYQHASLLGIVLLDNIDHDWSFVALGKDSDGTYRAFDSGVNHPSYEAAETALEKVLRDNETKAVFGSE